MFICSTIESIRFWRMLFGNFWSDIDWFEIIAFNLLIFDFFALVVL